MDAIQLQAAVDQLMPQIRKTMINDVHLEMMKVASLSTATVDDLSCAIEAVADNVLKAAAELFVESINDVLNPDKARTDASANSN
jgi:hypothetical protein